MSLVITDAAQASPSKWTARCGLRWWKSGVITCDCRSTRTSRLRFAATTCTTRFKPHGRTSHDARQIQSRR